MSQRYVTLPNGHQCDIGEYLNSWKALKSMAPDREISGWSYFPTEARDILRELDYGLHDRINRHLPWFGHGRKWSYEWQVEACRAARDLNTPRLAIHWLPAWLKPRFAHRLTSYTD